MQLAWSETEAVIIEFRDEQNRFTFDLFGMPLDPEITNAIEDTRKSIVAAHVDRLAGNPSPKFTEGPMTVTKRADKPEPDAFDPSPKLDVSRPPRAPLAP